jgi:hypothetical protein
VKHTAKYRLWLCVGYANVERTAICAIDVISADSSEDACRMFMAHPALAGCPIASADVRYVADGKLEKSWRMLRYAGGDAGVIERAKPPPRPQLAIHQRETPRPRPFALPATFGELLRGRRS